MEQGDELVSKERRLAASVPLAAVLYPDRDRPAANGSADHGQHVEGLGRPPDEASRGSVLSRLLHGLAAWVAAWREHRAVRDQLSAMSDRDLADIGLTRALIHSAFDPAFAREAGIPRSAASDQEQQVLAALGLSQRSPRPLADR